MLRRTHIIEGVTAMKRLRLFLAAVSLAVASLLAVPVQACPNCEKNKDKCDCPKKGEKCACGDKCTCGKKTEGKPIKK
jgi:hypothetical protein